MFYNGIWGTVCDDAWDLRDAGVVCRQLGFPGARSAPHSARFGQGIGQIWLDNVNCAGDEANFRNCQHSGWGIHNCVHGEDASVICNTGGEYEKASNFINLTYFRCSLKVNYST